jgi:hypothetical protein
MANSKANHPDHNARELRRHLVFRDLHRRGYSHPSSAGFDGTVGSLSAVMHPEKPKRCRYPTLCPIHRAGNESDSRLELII